jgi:hypothetical protein
LFAQALFPLHDGREGLLLLSSKKTRVMNYTQRLGAESLDMLLVVSPLPSRGREKRDERKTHAPTTIIGEGEEKIKDSRLLWGRSTAAAQKQIKSMACVVVLCKNISFSIYMLIPSEDYYFLLGGKQIWVENAERCRRRARSLWVTVMFGEFDIEHPHIG